jgi:hypothetical protein
MIVAKAMLAKARCRKEKVSGIESMQCDAKFSAEERKEKVLALRRLNRSHLVESAPIAGFDDV